MDRSRPCCGHGKVDLSSEFAVLQDAPTLVKDLLTDPSTPAGRKYLKDPRGYNRQARFGTLKVGTERSPAGGAVAVRLNGNMDILLSDLWCKEHQTPSHGQLYSMLPSESQAIRTQSSVAQNLDPEITTALDNCIRENHALASLYKNAAEIYGEEHERRRLEGTNVCLATIDITFNNNSFLGWTLQHSNAYQP